MINPKFRLKKLMRCESGVISIAEILVASSLLLLVAAGTLNGLIFSADTTARTNSVVIAGAVLQKEIEAVKTLGSNVTGEAYHQVSYAPQYGVERVVATDSPQAGIDKVTVNVYKYPKADGDLPLAELSFYVKQDGSGV